MSQSPWGVANIGENLVQPYWIVPIESARWAPLEGQYYALRGTDKEGTEVDVDPYKRTPPRMAPEPDGPIDRMWKWYDKGKSEADDLKRAQAVWEIIKIHINEGPFFQGSVANEPRVVFFKSDLRNVPLRENLTLGGVTEPWGHPTPAVYDPECFYWENPSKHQP
jgi:peptide/nickel transport system substrate-binding protein